MRSFVGRDDGRSIAIRGLRGVDAEADVHGDVVRPGASLLKLPLVVAVVDAATDGVLDLDATITPTQLASSCYPSVMQVFTPDHQFTTRELCGIALSTSDNPVAQHLLDCVGFDRANAVLERFGCRNSALRVGFADEHLGRSGRANVTTACDVVRLFASLSSDARYSYLVHALVNGVRKTRLPLRLPDDMHIANKSGSLEGVANDAGVLFGQHVDIALAVLTEAQPDTALTSIDIGGCVGEIWAALGEEVG